MAPSVAYFPNEKVKSMCGSNNWTLWNVWDPVIREVLPEILNEGCIPMSTDHFNDLFDATIRKLAHSFWGIEQNVIVAVVTPMDFPCVANKIITADPAYVYSSYSNRVEINVQTIPFENASESSPDEGIWEPELCSAAMTPPPSPLVATITAWGSLAQLLTLKVKVNDVFIISGGNVEITKHKGRTELRLNEWMDVAEEERDHLDLIHLRFEMDEGIGKIHMLEKIEPSIHVEDMFEFTYSTFKNKIGKKPYFKKLVLLRPFHLCEYEESECQKKKHEPFKIPIGRESREVKRVYMAMSSKTLCLLNYENERIEKRLMKELKSKCTMPNLMNVIFIAGIIVIIYAFSAIYVDILNTNNELTHEFCHVLNSE